MLGKLLISNVVPILQGLYVPWRLFIEKKSISLGFKGKTPWKDFRITIKIAVDEEAFSISKIQLVVYYQCCVLIGWATTGLYVTAH